MKVSTTLRVLRSFNPCTSGWRTLRSFLKKNNGGRLPAPDEPISLATVLESNGLYDAVWALQTVPGIDRELRLFACDVAEAIVSGQYRMNKTLKAGLSAARRLARGTISQAALDRVREAIRRQEKSAAAQLGRPGLRSRARYHAIMAVRGCLMDTDCGAFAPAERVVAIGCGCSTYPAMRRLFVKHFCTA